MGHGVHARSAGLLFAAVGVFVANQVSADSITISWSCESCTVLPEPTTVVYDPATMLFKAFTVRWNGVEFDFTFPNSQPTCTREWFWDALNGRPIGETAHCGLPKQVYPIYWYADTYTPESNVCFGLRMGVSGAGPRCVHPPFPDGTVFPLSDAGGAVRAITPGAITDQLTVGGGIIIATIADFDRPLQIADDFTVIGDRSMAVTKVEWVGLRSPPDTVAAGDPAFDQFSVRFFRSESGVPATVPLADVTVSAGIVETPTINGIQSLFSLELAPAVVLQPGSYFVSITADSRDYAPDDWTWYFVDGATTAYHRTLDDNPWSERGPLSYSFKVSGDEVTTPDPAALLSELAVRVDGVGPGGSLADKLAIAQSYYGEGDTQATCAMLSAFVNEIEAQTDKKIEAVLAGSLITDAEAIVTAIDCD